MAGGTRPAGVLVVTDVYPPISGGSGWSTHALVRVLRSRGHRVEVMEVDPGSAGGGVREFEGVEVRRIGVARARRSVSRRLGADDYAVARVAESVGELLARQPGLGLVHGQHLHSAPGAIRAARANGRASVVTLRDYWPVCLHGTSWWGGAHCPGCTTGRLTGCMSEVWGLPRVASRALVPWARRRLRARLEAVAAADAVVAVSEAVRELLGGRAPELEIAVVPNMVDPERSARAASRGNPLELPAGYLLAAGKLNAAKGFDGLVDALADAGCRRPLVVAGAGPLAEQLRERAADRGIELTTPGWVGGDDLLRMTRDAAAVLLPSAWAEPLSRVLLESMSLGTPVIAWRTGGSGEAIDDGRNGWLVDGTEGLERALTELDDDARRAEVGAQALITAHERFAPDAVYPRLMRVYDAALQRAAPGGGAR